MENPYLKWDGIWGVLVPTYVQKTSISASIFSREESFSTLAKVASFASDASTWQANAAAKPPVKLPKFSQGCCDDIYIYDL